MLVNVGADVDANEDADSRSRSTVHNQHGQAVSVYRGSSQGDGGTSEAICVRVRAWLTPMDRNRRLLAIGRAQPPPEWWWLSIKGPGSSVLRYGVNPWTSLEETAARALWARSAAQTLVCLDAPLGPAPRSIVRWMAERGGPNSSCA